MCNGHTITIVNNFMYVIGGRNADNGYSLNSISVYNILTQHWSCVEVNKTMSSVSSDSSSDSSAGNASSANNTSNINTPHTPIHQLYHTASPLCNPNPNTDPNTTPGARYILTFAGRIHTATKESDKSEQNVYIFDTFGLKWITPQLIPATPSTGAGPVVFPSIMCASMVCISDLQATGCVTKLLVYGGYFATTRTISNQVYLLTITEHVKPNHTHNTHNSHNTSSMVHEGQYEGEGDSDSEFTVSFAPLSNRAVDVGLGVGTHRTTRAPTPMMNHDSCLCTPFNDRDYVSESVSAATCAVQPVRMLVYGGVSK